MKNNFEFNHDEIAEAVDEVADLRDQFEPLIRFSDFNPPEFPLESLPIVLREMATEIALALEVPLEFAALAVLSGVNVCLLGSYRARVNDSYFEPCQLWVCVLLPTGTRKTPVSKVCFNPIRQWEANEIKKYDESKARFEADDKIQAEEIEGLSRKLREYAGNPSKQNEKETISLRLREMMANRREKVFPPRLVLIDVTTEKVAQMMSQNHQRMALISDEGGNFLSIVQGKYQSGIPSFDLYLQSYSSSPVRVDRKSSEAIVMNDPSLSISITVQPGVLKKMASQEIFRDSGFLARFLFLMPVSNVGYRACENRCIDDVILQRYEILCNRLLGNSTGARTNENPWTDVLMSSEARNLYQNYVKEVEQMLRPEVGEMADFVDWGTKFVGNVLRIAITLHFAANPSTLSSVELSAETFKNAMAIGNSLIPHARASLGLLNSSPFVEKAMSVLRWIKEKPRDQFAKNEVLHALRGRLKDVENLDKVLEVLEQHHYVARYVPASSGKKGRKSEFYLVNPAVYES